LYEQLIAFLQLQQTPALLHQNFGLHVCTPSKIGFDDIKNGPAEFDGCCLCKILSPMTDITA